MDVCLTVKQDKIRIGSLKIGLDDGFVELDDLCDFVTLASGEKLSGTPKEIFEMCAAISADIQLWPLLVSRQKLDQEVETVMRRAHDCFSCETSVSYFKHWLRIKKFLRSLEDVHVNEDRWKELCKTVNPLKSHKKCFLKAAGRLEKTVYTTDKSSTGRLTVTSGPNFLILPAECRKSIKPSAKDSKIVNIDFTSLEPRVALMVTEVETPPDDVYRELMRTCDIKSRKAAKLATISALYGASPMRLVKTLGSRKKASALIESVKRYFKVPQLQNSLDVQAQNGMVRNAFGRPLREATVQQRVRLNHHIQSTAAELAVLLFSDLCEISNIKPLLLVHDALIAEVSNDEFINLQTAASSLTHNGIIFPTKIELLHN